jgi:hypothetical protein
MLLHMDFGRTTRSNSVDWLERANRATHIHAIDREAALTVHDAALSSGTRHPEPHCRSCDRLASYQIRCASVASLGMT